MPGSCDSDQSNSSSSVISSLRRFRFQNKSKQSQATENSTPSSSNTGTSSSSPARPILSQKSSTSAYNPLSYRKYDSSSDSQLLLQNISAKIQTLFKTTAINIPFLELKLTIGENDQFKDIVLQDSSLSIKWSSCISETSSLAPNEKLYKVKRTYLSELSKHICNVLNSKLAKNNSVQFTPENPPIRTYSRSETIKSPANQNILSNSVPPSDNQNNGAMDDYEEFCEKEQSLRKMLDAFPGADIMEAQDILVKCQWNLNKAIQEGRSLPLRTTSRKRGHQGPFMVQSPPAENIPNQRTMSNSQPIQSPPNTVPEEIVIDSSDEEDINGNSPSVPSQPSRPAVIYNRPSPAALPPAKRARRPISTSTSSSEDEAASAGSKSSVSPAFQRAPMQQNLQVSIAPVQKQPGSVVQVTRTTPIPKPVSTPPTDIRLSINQNSPLDKTINVPQALSIKPIPVSTPSNNEQTSSSSNMPNLPKGLVITQLGGANKSTADEDVEAPLNGNHPSNIPLNFNKSAQLIRVKSSNSVSVTSSNTPVSINADVSFTPVNKNVSITPVSKNISVTPVGKSVSFTPVTQAVNIASAPKNLSITPVGGSNEVHASNNMLHKEKSPFSSSASTEEESVGDIKPKKGKKRIKNIESLKESKESDNSEVNELNDPVPVQKAKSPEKKKGRPKGSTKQASPKQVNSHKVAAKHTKRKNLCYDEDEDEDYGNEDIYDSEDSDCGENLTPAHSAVLKFFQEATPDELASVPGCSKRKIEVLQNLRPFSKWMDLVEKLRNDKTLSTDLLNGVKKVLDMRNAINKLMNKCQRISLDMEDLVEDLKENKESSSGYVSKQPELLNERMHLTAYQMLGLNWLLLMHNQQVNAILADEMGLGKTVQAVSFLAYLKQIEEYGPHLIVVPSSTLDNWKKELETWWPTVSIICYHGQQESRRDLRMQILNDEVDEFDVMITTYNMVTSSAEDRSFFKRLEFNYVVFDEAHMLKNMSSQRYTNLMRIKAPRRLLLTGTPLQNNLVELMSLLIFAMPNMFSGKTEQIKQMFTCVSKADGSRNSYEKDRIDHAKRIMKPFVLRRLKKDVLKELPAKVEETKLCPMVEDQAEKYKDLVKKFSDEVQTESKEDKEITHSGAGMMMQLRRGANHPLLLRRFYDDDKLLVMAKKMLKEPTHSQSDPNMIFEDMAVMSDFELHKLCNQYKSIKSHALTDATILNSGKFKVLDELLPDLIHEDHRILLFSQFTMVLDIVQDYMNIKEYKFLRLDGQTPVSERQQLIDEFNNDPEILVFLLSTRAGGLGINLTAADTVILHDIDFNPYNDKQAEDRCHRVGQVRDVRVIRLISENTIEEGILQRAKEKLKLERDIHDEETEESDTASVAMLLRDALGLNTKKS